MHGSLPQTRARGDSLTRSGATSTKKPGETVTVIARPAGEPEAHITVADHVPEGRRNFIVK